MQLRIAVAFSAGHPKASGVQENKSLPTVLRRKRGTARHPKGHVLKPDRNKKRQFEESGAVVKAFDAREFRKDMGREKYDIEK